MQQQSNGPDPRERKQNGPKENVQPEDNRQREGGDDALTQSSPTDSRSDEKVIVNEQRQNKTVNAPSQTAPNATEGSDEIIDR